MADALQAHLGNQSRRNGGSQNGVQMRIDSDDNEDDEEEDEADSDDEDD